MFGLPLFRSGTKIAAEVPKPCDTDGYGQGCDPYIPKTLKSALRLAQMVYNHYSLIISADYKTLRAWGNCTTLGNTATNDTNVPQTSLISWDTAPETIIKIYSNGNHNGWGTGFTIFHTEERNLYGTGNNATNCLGRGDAGSRYRLIARDVIDYCVAGTAYMLFVRSDGKLYGLGSDLVAGYGFSQANRRALPTDNQTNLTVNYLGINNAVKVFATSPGGSNKSFVLLSDGRVMACGYNTSGCLGVGSNDPIIYEWRPVKTVDYGNNLKDLTDVVDVVTTNFVLGGGANTSAETWQGGGYETFMSTYFLTKTGEVYTCGSNKFGQLGINELSNVTKNVATKTSINQGTLICTTAGGASVLVATLDNKVYTWGNNQWGQLGTGDRSNRYIPTRVVFPDKKIKMIHGGGMYGNINGAFLVICDDGTLYGAGFNETYALGITKNGNPDSGPITTFTRNEYFGEDPIKEQDPQRYPITIVGGNDTIAGSPRVTFTKDSVVKNTRCRTGVCPETIYIRQGMRVEGPGIPPKTYIIFIDRAKKYFIMSNPATSTSNNLTLTYVNIVKVYQADLCGYGTEMAQKVVAEDGTLYMSGWNQFYGSHWNFNWYYGSENVAVPTYFDAAFS